MRDRDDVCWVSMNHVLCLIKTVNSQSAGACGYCLSEKEFDNILKLFENFSVFCYNLTVLKFQVSNYRVRVILHYFE